MSVCHIGDMAAAQKTAGKRLPAGFLAQAGKGRPKGVTNKATAAVKDMVIEALSRAGGTAYLVEQAQKNPNAFMSLVAKVIPTQLTGDPENPIAIADMTQDAERVAAMIDSLARRTVEGVSLQ
jgi:hypothetical protein